MKFAHVLYGLGVTAGGFAGWLSPWPYTGFVPVAAGLVWAAYDLVEVDGAEPASTPPRR